MRASRLHSLVLALWAGVPLAQAADAEKLRGFGLAETAAAPAYGRILIAFLLVAALAWASVWLMRRYGFRGPLRGLAAPGAGAQVRPLGRNTLPGGTVCHVVEVQGKTVLITVTRHGVTSLVLGDATPPAEARAP